MTKSTINAMTMQKLFGGIPLTFPEGTPLIQMLDLLNEQQLYRLNLKICSLYHKNLAAKHNRDDKKLVIDTDPRIRKYRPTISESFEPPHQGPPLQRKPGRYKFKDM